MIGATLPLLLSPWQSPQRTVVTKHRPHHVEEEAPAGGYNECHKHNGNERSGWRGLQEELQRRDNEQCR